MEDSERSIDFNETSNSLDYFSRAFTFLRQTPEDPYAWKWVIISLHSALYGFAIIACAGTDYFQVLKKTKNKELSGNEDLISFFTAIERLKNSKQFNNRLILDEGQQRSINFLSNELRNEFMHFRPSSWTILIQGMPKIIKDITNIIEIVALNMTINVQLTLYDKYKIKYIAEEIRHFLKNCSLAK